MGRAAIPITCTSLGTGRRIPVAARALSLVASGLALLLAAPSALAQEAALPEPVGLERLKVEHRILFKEYDRPAARDRFLERIEEQRKSYEKSSADRVSDLEQFVIGPAYEARFETFVKAGDKKRASEIAGKILKLMSDAGMLAELKTRADAYITKVAFEGGEASFKAGLYAEAEAAYKNCLGARDKSIGLRSAVQIVVIETELAKLKEIPEDDLAALGGALETILGKVERVFEGTAFFTMDFPELKDLKDHLKDTKGKAGVVKFAFFTPKAGAFKYEGHSFPAGLQTATFRFEPVGEGKPFPRKGTSGALSKDSLLWFNGTYTVKVFVNGAGDMPVETWRGVTLEAGKTFTVEVPDRFPEGMVYVHTGGFFIDRFEVTNTVVAAVKGSDNLLTDLFEDGKPNVPVWCFEDDKLDARIKAFEKASGKSVPSDGQWRDACFGGAATPWPWGGEEPTQEQAVFAPPKRNDPLPVGGRVKGESPFGVQDMAGNMAEWVRYRNGYWLMGGSFKDEALSKSGRNLLKDPMPTKRGRAALADAKDRESYAQYFADAEGDSLSGLRMVVPAK